MQMKEITVGRAGCDVIIPDDCVSRKHAVVTLVNGQYVYNDVSKNGTAINGRIYKNEKVVVSPGTPIYLSNKVPFPWAQVLMLLPNRPVCVPGSGHGGQETSVEQGRVNHESRPASGNRTIGIGWGIVSFVFPIVGFIMYFVWKDSENYKAKQAANLAWASIIVNFILGFIGGLL